MGRLAAVVARLAGAARLAGRLCVGACVSHLGGRRPLPHTLLAAALVLAAVLWFDRDIFDQEGQFNRDGHAAFSLEIAVNHHQLGRRCTVRDFPRSKQCVRALLLRGDDVRSERVLDLPARVTPSPEEYAEHTQPFRNNENSLMLLDDALLWVAPGLTVGGLARVHMALKAACLAAFAVLLLAAGFGPLLAGAALHLGLLVVARLSEGYPLSLYPLVPAVTLLFLSVLGLVLATGAHRRLVAALPALALAGAVAGFLVNLRTSYTPVAAAVLLLYVLTAALDLRRRQLAAWRIGALMVLGLTSFAGGYKLFSSLCIDPVKEAGAAGDRNYTHHVIGHPLVLALAVPPNDLAAREGITWNDLRGLELARRIDPAVRYMDEHYDAALLTYYLKLWLYYPGEMRDLYAAKLDKAGVSCLPYLAERAEQEEKVGTTGLGTLGSQLSWPLGLLPAGRQWLLALGALALAALVAGRWLGAAASFTLAALAATAALLLLEATLVLPDFYLQYHAPLLLLALLAGLAPYQLGLDAVAWLGQGIAVLARRVLGRRGASVAGGGSQPPRAAA
jgi:hypothetical protein